MGTKKLRTSTQNLVRYSYLCDQCGKVFNCARPDARFCQSKCRQKWYRAMKKVMEGHAAAAATPNHFNTRTGRN